MDYEYEPDPLEEPIVEEEEVYEREDSIDDYETTINDLDKIERTTQAITINPETENQQFPNILEKPLFMKVVPEGGTMTSVRQPKIKNKSTVIEFIKGIIMSYLGIIEDIFTIEDYTFDNIKNIFTKDNRVMAIGILFMAISIVYLFLK
jgi:hypothetical protein